jgi:hypothetical protein
MYFASSLGGYGFLTSARLSALLPAAIPMRCFLSCHEIAIGVELRACLVFKLAGSHVFMLLRSAAPVEWLHSAVPLYIADRFDSVRKGKAPLTECRAIALYLADEFDFGH